MQIETYHINKGFYRDRKQVTVELIADLKWAEYYCTGAHYDGQIDLVTAVEKSDDIDKWINDCNTTYINVTEVGNYYFLVIHAIDKDNKIPRCSKEELHEKVNWDNLYVVQYSQDFTTGVLNPFSVIHLIGIDNSDNFLCDNVVWHNMFNSPQKCNIINTHTSIKFDNLQTGAFQRLYVNKALLADAGKQFYYTMLGLVLSKMNIEFENEYTDKSITWDNYIEKLSPEIITANDIFDQNVNILKQMRSVLTENNKQLNKNIIICLNK